MELLATAGNTVKLWDITTFSICQEIPFENGRVSGLTWSQDGQCIASLGETGEEIFLAAIKAKSAANIGVVRGIEAPSCIKFASRVPHYLGVGTHTGTIAIWNVKSQAEKKTVTVTDGGITKICFSSNDSHITAATKKGTLFSLSVVNNATTGPFRIFDNQGVTGLMYNRVKRSLVGCCSDVGGVALFDTHAGKLVHSIPQAHAAPAAAIAFSPLNEFLMVSVGYDKKFVCYNVQTKEPLMTYCSPAPLTSVTFLAGGQRVALGTMTGQVFVHDLRCLRPCLATLSAHTSGVSAILLQPSARSKSERTISGSRMAAQPSTTATSLAVKHQKPCKSWSGQAEKGECAVMKVDIELSSEKPATGKQELSPDVFSPIRNTMKGIQNSIGSPICTEAPAFSKSPELHDVFSPIRQTDNHTTGSNSTLAQKQWSHNIDEDDVLSPIRYTEDTTFPSGRINPSYLVPQIQLEPSDSPARHRDKENIEPLSGQEESEMEAQDSSQTSKMMPTTPHGEQFVSDGVLSPLCSTGNVPENTEFNQIKETDCNDSHDSQDATVMEEYTSKKCIERRAILSPHTNKTPRQDLSASHDSYPTNIFDKAEDDTPATKAGRETSGTMETPSLSATPVLPKHFTRSAPPRKKQFLMPIHGSDLFPETPELVTKSKEIQGDSPAPLIESNRLGSSETASQLQVELVRNCVAEVVEEFHDDVNRRLLHLQYIITKSFIQQQEVMEKLHRQYSLNEDLLQENERLRQELSHLQAKY